MRYDAIYFDLDGTLWDTTDLTFDSANKIAEKYNLPAVPREKIEECMGKTKDECADLLYPEFSHEQALEYLEEALDLTTQKLLIQGGKVYDGLEDTLKELVNRGYKLGIVSNCLEGYIEAFMISSRLGKYFNDIVAAGKKEIKKSDAIKLAIERDGMRSAIYVGDTLKDQEAAEGAGLEFIHARYGFCKNLNAEYYIDSIKDLPDFMSKIDS
mgnify:CR=1 FL=1|jgi:phosphoglycolate phosphatase